EAQPVDANPGLIRKRGVVPRAIGLQKRSRWLGGLLCLVAFGILSKPGLAQGPTVDTTIPVMPGTSGSLLGKAPGGGGSSFLNLPGTGGILGGRPGASTPRGLPAALATPGVGPGPTDLQAPISAPQPAPVSPTTTPFYGTLEIPTGDQADDGPPDGLT